MPWFVGLFFTAGMVLFFGENWNVLAAASGVYWFLVVISLAKIIMRQRRWQRQWDEAAIKYTELCKVILNGLKRSIKFQSDTSAMDKAYWDLCLEVHENIPLHPGLFYCHGEQDVSVTRRWAFGTPETDDIRKFIGQLVYEGLVNLSQFIDSRATLGMAPIRVVADPGGATIMFLWSLQDEYADVKWQYVVGVMSIGCTGQTAVINVSTNIYYGCKIGQRLREDTWVPGDVSVAAKAWIQYDAKQWLRVLPFVCLIFIPEFLLSLWRRYPFTTGNFRFYLAPEFGELAEHIYIQKIQRPWEMNLAFKAHLTGIQMGMREALHGAIIRTFEKRMEMVERANQR